VDEVFIGPSCHEGPPAAKGFARLPIELPLTLRVDLR